MDDREIIQRCADQQLDRHLRSQEGCEDCGEEDCDGDCEHGEDCGCRECVQDARDDDRLRVAGL